MLKEMEKKRDIKQIIKDRREKINQGIVPEGYKKTKVGIIPEDWTVKKLGELLIKILGGGTPNRKNPNYFNGNIPWATVKDMGDENYKTETIEYISEEGLENSNANLITAKNLIVSTRMGLGKGFINNTDMAINQDLKGLYPDKSKLNVDFLMYWYKNQKRRIEILGAGSTVKGIDLNTLKNLRVAKPKLMEQQKIADVLSTWDRAIELKESFIQEKEEQKKGIMVDLLTPKSNWRIKKLSDIVTRTKGKAVKLVENGRYPVLDSQYLNGEREPVYTNDDSVLAEKNDILLLWDGSKAGSIYTEFKGVVGSTFMRLRPKDVNSIFIREYMRKDESFIKSIREGSGIPHVPRDFLTYYKVPLPPLPVQRRIAKILSTADREIELLKQEVEQLKEQKKGLMQLLLTGIVRVKEVEHE